MESDTLHLHDPAHSQVLADDRRVRLRLVEHHDAAALAAAYRENREHLAPWEPLRPDIYFDAAMQAASITRMRQCLDAGTHLPLVLTDGEAIIGAVTISNIVRGGYQHGDLGYWLDHRYVGRGVMSAAIEKTMIMAREDLRLHRLQAAAMPANTRSRQTLLRAGFHHVGLARQYMSIAGRWEDHDLFERLL